MIEVSDLIDGVTPPVPRTEPSRTRPVARATDSQVVIRSLAEQLVSEANAVLSAHGETITLVDDSGPSELAFSLSYRDRVARIRTTVSSRTATAELAYAGAPQPQQQLTGEDQLRALLLNLVAGASVN
jgi:hypothetical protein